MVSRLKDTKKKQANLWLLSQASKPTASIQDAFDHFANLYCTYTIILKDLDTCYDLSVQPQKRLDIKSTLLIEHVICRVINLRHLLHKCSPPSNDVLVKDGVQPPFPWEYLDINKELGDLSIAPSRLETTTPTYFKEDRQEVIRFDFSGQFIQSINSLT